MYSGISIMSQTHKGLHCLFHCTQTCSDQYSYVRWWEQPWYFLFFWIFFVVYTFYILTLRLFLLHSCFTEADSHELCSVLVPEYPFTVFRACGWSHDEGGVCWEVRRFLLSRSLTKLSSCTSLLKIAENMIILKRNHLQELGIKM